MSIAQLAGIECAIDDIHRSLDALSVSANGQILFRSEVSRKLKKLRKMLRMVAEPVTREA